VSGPIPPGSTIGILGGGQLGRMTALAAARLGYRCHVLAPEAEAPAAEVAAAWTRAPYGDEAALDRFAAAVDVVTLEFENVPVAALERLAARVPVRPGSEVLRVTQDRVAEKDRLRRLGAPVTGYAPIGGPAEVGPALAGLGGRGVLKTTRLGYDGKGQLLVDAATDPTEAWSGWAGRRWSWRRFVDPRAESSRS
jgi:5-(carboxyamino)imidazole ribonucleotide synthase